MTAEISGVKYSGSDVPIHPAQPVQPTRLVMSPPPPYSTSSAALPSSSKHQNQSPSEIVFRGDTYVQQEKFDDGLCRPALYASPATKRAIVYKTFPTNAPLEYRQTVQTSHRTWQQVREALVPHGFPDILEQTEQYQIREYVPGIALADFIDSPLYIACLPSQLATACTLIDWAKSFTLAMSHHLDCLEEQRISHGDLKPSNVILHDVFPSSDPASCTLIDYDFMHPFGTRFGRHVFSTPYYATLELLQYNRYGPTTDIFALALMALEILNGQDEWFRFRNFDWADNIFVGKTLDLTRARKLYGIPYQAAIHIRSWMHDRISATFSQKTLMPSEDLEERSTEIRQLVLFIFSALQNDMYRRPQSGKEIRQMLTDKGNLTQV